MLIFCEDFVNKYFYSFVLFLNADTAIIIPAIVIITNSITCVVSPVFGAFAFDGFVSVAFSSKLLLSFLLSFLPITSLLLLSLLSESFLLLSSVLYTSAYVENLSVSNEIVPFSLS